MWQFVPRLFSLLVQQLTLTTHRSLTQSKSADTSLPAAEKEGNGHTFSAYTFNISVHHPSCFFFYVEGAPWWSVLSSDKRQKVCIVKINEPVVSGDDIRELTICFSVYLLELSRLTASMWPKSMSWPSRKMKSSLHTYFFLLYPSRALSPLNLERMLASSLLIRLISASLLLPKKTGEEEEGGVTCYQHWEETRLWKSAVEGSPKYTQLSAVRGKILKVALQICPSRKRFLWRKCLNI